MHLLHNLDEVDLPLDITARVPRFLDDVEDARHVLANGPSDDGPLQALLQREAKSRLHAGDFLRRVHPSLRHLGVTARHSGVDSTKPCVIVAASQRTELDRIKFHLSDG